MKTFVGLVLIMFMSASIFFTVKSVGEPRPPVTNEVAAGTILVGGLFILGIFYLLAGTC